MPDHLSEALTPLEQELLHEFRRRYEDKGFPPTNEVRLESRSNTGAGRYTFLKHEGLVGLENGQLGLGVYSQIEMEGLDVGASFWVFVKDNKVLYLEIAVNGNQCWDGLERSWVICDPDTGLFKSKSTD